MLPLTLTIILANGPFPTTKSVPLDVVFKNVSTEAVRILKYFDDQENLPIWFDLRMVRSDGTPVTDVRGGGKINLRGQLDYVTLAPGGSFAVRLDIAKFAPHLTEGSYSVLLVYRNQYGQNCFKGQLESNTIAVMIKEPKAQ